MIAVFLSLWACTRALMGVFSCIMHPSATVLGRFLVYIFVLFECPFDTYFDVGKMDQLSYGVILSFWDMDPVQDIIYDA